MLVIISDLHLTDGSRGSATSPGAFHLLAERLADLAVRASCRGDGSYRPIERIDLLLLGDVLDVVHSSRWLTKSVRPWSDPNSAEMVEMVSAVTGKILQRNDEALGVLRRLASEGPIRIAPAHYLARPLPSAEQQAVPVRIHYMVGNRDWFYHLPNTQFDLVRQQVVRHMGLANPHDKPFPHDPRENEELLEVLRRHRVFARHGDVFDPFNFQQDRDASSLGDAVAVELISRFAEKVTTELAADLPQMTLAGLHEVDNVRPVLLVPVWLDGLLERTCPSPALRKRIKHIWDELVDAFLEVPFVKESWGSNGELVDGLQRTLKFSGRLSIGRAKAVVDWLNGLRGSETSSYFEHALAEEEFRNRRAKHIVYGHTHQTETVPLDASFAEGYVLDQLYFNAGTWRRVHSRTQLAPGEHEFIASDALSFLIFYQGDERRGRPYETWTGNLAAQQFEPTVHRLDPAASHSTVDYPAMPGPPRPHFVPSKVDRTPVVPKRRA